MSELSMPCPFAKAKPSFLKSRVLMTVMGNQTR
jgi:hypothetical protein